MKNKITILSLIVCLVSFSACEEKKTEYPDIKIGKETAITELSLNKGMERKIILSGGNNKYAVNVEDSKIATATISEDTLKVRGLLEGETFATILSHDKRAKLKIKVIFAKLGISHSEIQLVPTVKNKEVTISGGGENIKIEKNDPANILSFKWDAASRSLEITPNHEGEAEITAISEDGADKATVKVKVKPEGEVSAYGLYGTNRASYYLAFNNLMVADRKNAGVLITNTTNPYEGARIKIAPIVNPVAKDSLEIRVISSDYKNTPKLDVGVHKVYVEEVRDTEVMLRGKGFKFLLPYRK